MISKISTAFFCLLVICGQLSAHSRNNYFADLLILSAQESGTESWGQIFTGSGSDTIVELLDVDFGWDAGFRAGIDYAFDCNRSDLRVSYTWFRTNSERQASSSNLITSSFLGNFYIGNPAGINDSGPQYHNATLHWMIQCNIVDVELGKEWCAAPSLTFRPFIGLKGGWIHQTINTVWLDPVSGDFSRATENLRNDFCGIGPGCGVEASWLVGSPCSRPFSLLANVSGALMWGRWSFEDVYNNDEPATVVIDMPDIYGAATMLRTFLGCEWGLPSFSGCYTFSIRAGYEAQFWLDQLRYYSFNVGRLNNALTLQGGSIEFIVHF